MTSAKPHLMQSTLVAVCLFLVFLVTFFAVQNPKSSIIAFSLAIVMFGAIWSKTIAFSAPVVSVLFESTLNLGQCFFSIQTLVLLAVSPAIAIHTFKFLTPHLKWLLFSGLGVIWLQYVFAIDKFQSFSLAFSWSSVLAYAICIFPHLQSRVCASSFRKLILLVGAGVVIIGLAQGIGVNVPGVGASYSPNLPDSTFGYYSNYATFVAVLMCFTFESILQHRTAFALKFLHFGLFFASAIEILICASRGAAIISLVGIVLITIQTLFKNRDLRNQQRNILVTVVVVGSLYFLLVQTATATRIFERFSIFQPGDLTRIQLQSVGFNLLSESPLGLGLGGFKALAESGRIFVVQALAHCHNLYVQIGLDFGWVGLIGFIALIIGAVRHGLGVARTLGSALPLAALTGLLIQGFQDYLFFETSSLLIFALVLVFIFAQAEKPSSAHIGIPLKILARNAVGA